MFPGHTVYLWLAHFDFSMTVSDNNYYCPSETERLTYSWIIWTILSTLVMCKTFISHDIIHGLYETLKTINYMYHNYV